MDVSGRRGLEVSGRRTCYRGSAGSTPLCDLCQAVHDDVDACSYCMDCNDYLCEKCAKRHRISKLSLSHKILNQNEMPKKRLSSVNSNVCAKHGEIFRYYCQAHSELCCSSCVASIHAKCQTEPLKALASNFGKSSRYKHFRGNLKRLSEELSQLQNSLDNAVSSSKKNYDQMISDIQNYRREINNRLDTLEKEVREDIEKLKSHNETKLKSLNVDCRTIQCEVDKLTINLDDLESYNHHELLFVSVLITEASISAYHKKMETISNEAGQTDEDKYQFTINEELQEVMKSIHTFGKVERNLDDASKERSADYFQSKGQINVKCPKDSKDCWITGCVDLGDGYMAIADHNNSCIKILDIENDTIMNHVQLPFKPWDIARASGRHLVVSCDDRLVHLRVRWQPLLNANSVSNEGSLVKIDGTCSGVIHGNGKLVVSVLDPAPVILVMKANGVLKQKIPTNENGHGIFTSPFYVTTGANTQDIFVSDYDKNQVIRMDVNGRIKATYEDKLLSGPYGLARTDDGEIFVVGSKSSNVHKLSESCGMIEICLDEEDGIESPQAIEFCEESRKLVISHNQLASSSVRNVLSVYSFHN